MKDAIRFTVFTLIVLFGVAVCHAEIGSQIGDRPDPTERVDIVDPDTGKVIGCYGGAFSTCNKYNTDSIENPYGKGSRYRSDSLSNEYGQYGSRYSAKSWRNPYASRPPVVRERERGLTWKPKPYPGTDVKGTLTTNDYRWDSLRRWDRDLDTSIKVEILDED